MKYLLILRWFVYLVCSTSASWGLVYVPSQMDSSKQLANFLNSSPNTHRNGDQLYSTWTQWSSCSVSCGVGISSRTRKCLKSTYNSRGVPISLCHGEFEEHKICKLKPCPKDTPSVREAQCSQNNNKVIAGKLVKIWIPSNDGPNPCELRCEAKTEQLVYSFGKLTDGTPCPLGACLDGRCLAIGCDDRLGSNVVVDMCGVCGGRNSTCVHYKDVFQGQPSSVSGSRSVYHEVVSITTGARNLIIHQPLGKNLLALQDRSKGIIFNDEQNMNKYGGSYDIAGSPVEYKKSNNLTEELFVRGPLTQELYVLVLLRSPNPGIYYEYWLPKQQHTNGVGQFSMTPMRSNFPNPTKPTIPTKPQSYTVPFYNARSVSNHANHHPTKPAFAYGYGEKPYKGQEPPVFRHLPTTTISPREYPLRKPPIQSPSYADQSRTSLSSSVDRSKNSYNLKRDVVLGYKPRYIKPEADYYQMFRNVTRVTTQKPPEFARELPAQGDSGVPSGHHENAISNAVYNDKKNIPINFGIKLDKRDGKPDRKFISNGRLKYSLESKADVNTYENKSGISSPESLAINVLALPEKGKPKVSLKSVDTDQKPRPTRGGRCEPCQRKRNQTKHFCESDFVVRAQVVGYEFLHGETRYELEVLQSFKNTLSLLSKEYVWSPDTCRCPKLRQGKEYVLMGRSDNSYKKRESRLLVDKNSFVRIFNLKYARRLQKLRKDEAKKCKKAS